MRNYELMVILDPSIDERTVAPMMEKYLAPVAANGGSVENVDVWGKRRLAYDILKRSDQPPHGHRRDHSPYEAPAPRRSLSRHHTL